VAETVLPAKTQRDVSRQYKRRNVSNQALTHGSWIVYTHNRHFRLLCLRGYLYKFTG